MAKRIVCCPDANGFEYLYVDTAELLVENITDEISVLASDAQNQCCLAELSGYALGEKVLEDNQQNLFSFDFYKLNSFELFKDTEELRLKTGSEKILHSCLLNYYRREYDGTQQHTFFSEPAVSNTYIRNSGGVEHELTLEDRVLVQNASQDEVELETLDKGKSDAEREAAAEQARAEAEQQAAIAEAEEKAEKKEKQKKSRKVHERIMEEERYREFRNQDNVQSAEYQRFRQYEEEMRNNNAYLTSQYDEGNYSSLPGVVTPETFASLYENESCETLGVAIDNRDLYQLAARMDEFGVPYTVEGETLSDGRQISYIYYSSDYADQGSSAKDFFELERNLRFDDVINSDNYYSAFQLGAFEYAYANNIDTFYVANGSFNGNQMFRILDAGLNGHDMATLANPAYSTAHMDALCYYMNNGWDTAPIGDPMIGNNSVADNLIQEEIKHGVSHEHSFFTTHDYDAFLSYSPVVAGASFFNDYDNAQLQKYYKQLESANKSANLTSDLNTYKENLHASYEQRQREMNYISDNKNSHETDVVVPDSQSSHQPFNSANSPNTAGVPFVNEHGSSQPQNRFTQPDPLNKTGNLSNLNALRENLRSSHNPQKPEANSGSQNVPLNNPKVLDLKNPNHTFNSSYTLNGFNRNDGSFSPYNSSKMPFVNPATPNGGGTGGGKGPIPTSPSGNKLPGKKYHPLDDLKVRSDFARKAGLKVQTYGNKCVSTAIGSVRQSFRSVSSKLTQNDESGTVHAYNSTRRTVGNVVLAAQLVTDLPRQFTRAGQNVSYTANAVANAGRRLTGKEVVKKEFKTITSEKQAIKNIRDIQTKQFNSIKKEFGVTAAKMNIREINSNIKRLNKDKLNLIKENQALKQNIREYYGKKGLSAADRKSLKNLMDKKKANEAVIKNKARDIKKLNDLKSKKKANSKRLTAAENKKLDIGKKDGRKKRAKAAVVNSLVSQLHRSGDNTFSGMATASGYMMSYARSPISRLVNKTTNFLVVKPVKFVAVKTGKLVNKTVVKPVARVVGRKVVKPATKVVKKTVIKPVNKRIIKPVENKLVKPVKNQLKKVTNSQAFKVSQKLFRKGKKGASFVGKVISAPFKVVGKIANVFNVVSGAIKKFLIKVAFAALGVVLALLIFIRIVGVIGEISASVIPGSELTEDGRVDLSSYVAVINEAQASLNQSIQGITLKDDYDNVFYDFNGNADNNTAQILAMAYTRFNESFETNRDAVDAYMTQLHKDSNYFDYAESELYSCEEGCVERSYFCYEKPDEYASETRKSLYLSSKGKGCIQSKAYSCMEKTVLGKHNDGKAMDSPCSCDNYTTKTVTVETDNIVYYCPGEPYMYSEQYWVTKYCSDAGWGTSTKKVAMTDPCSHGERCTTGKATADVKKYYCQGYTGETYHKNGCKIHNNGKATTTPCSCDNYKTKVEKEKVIKYYCQGYFVDSRTGGSYVKHNDGKAMNNPCSCDDCKEVEETEEFNTYICQGYCSGDHYDYSCKGHTERVCYGEHQDVTITITSLDFDAIFDADSSVAGTGTTLKGEAYKDKFVITGYCSCSECCGEDSTGKTASGTTPKANHTIATDWSVIPKGTHVWIDGKEYVAEDKGGAIEGNRIDIYFNSHNEALQWGKRTKTVYKSTVIESGYDAEKDEYGFAGWTKDNRDIAKNVYESLVSDKADQLYEGLNGITDIAYGHSASSNADFSDIVFDDASGLTNNQQKVLAVIESRSIKTVSGMCQAWVADVYQAALGGARTSKCCANHAGEAWGVSNSWKDIQVGATVYGYSSSKYGHVGIYIGDGKVAHNIGYLKVQSLESWVKTYNGQCWGWNGGKNLTGNSKYNCKAAGTFMHGKD